MDVINKLYSSVSNSVSQLSSVLPGNPLAREYDIESQVCSAGIGKFSLKKLWIFVLMMSLYQVCYGAYTKAPRSRQSKKQQSSSFVKRNSTDSRAKIGRSCLTFWNVELYSWPRSATHTSSLCSINSKRVATRLHLPRSPSLRVLQTFWEINTTCLNPTHWVLTNSMTLTRNTDWYKCAKDSVSSTTMWNLCTETCAPNR